MRQLTLTNEQFEVLFDIMRDTVDVIEGDLITTNNLLQIQVNPNDRTIKQLHI